MEVLLDVFGLDFALVGELAVLFGGFILLSVQGLKVLVPSWMEGNEHWFVFGHAAVLDVLALVALFVEGSGRFISLGLGLYSASIVSALSYRSFGRSLFERLGLQEPNEE